MTVSDGDHDLRRRLVADLYGEDAAEEITAAIEERLRRGRWTRDRAVVGAQEATLWDEHDAWLVTYPDQFRSPSLTPLAALHRFVVSRLRPHLNGVHVLPFHPSSSDEGFAVVDYSEVDPRHGTWADVEALARGARLMVDAVVNHTSSESPWFRRFLAGDPAYTGFYRTADPGCDLTRVVRPRASPLLTRFEGAAGPLWVWTTFSADQVDLDYREPRVLLAILDVLLDCVERGADVIRLDAVAFLWKEEGTSSIHHPRTHALVHLFRACLDAIRPDVLLVTETNVPHQENIAYLGDGSVREAQAAYQFPLPPLVLDALLTGDVTRLATWAGTVDSPPGTTFLNFLASHDGVGLRPAEGLLDRVRIDALVEATRRAGGEVSWRSAPDGGRTPYELNSTWFDLCHAGVGEAAAVSRHLATHAALLSLRGIPLVYVHSLLGTSNDQDGYRASGLPRALNRRRFECVDRLEALLTDPGTREARVFQDLRAMLSWRAASPAFHPDSPQAVRTEETGVLRVDRGPGPDGSRARVLVNLGDGPVEIAPPDEDGWRRCSSGEPVATDEPVELPAWSSLWLYG